MDGGVPELLLGLHRIAILIHHYQTHYKHMTTHHRFLSPVVLGLLALAYALCATGCHRKGKEPRKPFKPIVSLDEKGELKDLPTPFLRFGKHSAEVINWEKDHGAELTNRNSQKIVFLTNDPQKINPVRGYHLEADTLIAGELILKSDLLFSEKKLKPGVKALLASKGYTESEKNELSSEADAFFVNAKDTLSLAIQADPRTEYSKVTFRSTANKHSGKRFLPIVELDEKGILKNIPLPMVDFHAANKAAIREWEFARKSLLILDKADELGFITGEKHSPNPERRYKLNASGKLIQSQVEIKRSLIVEKERTIRAELTALLIREGYALDESATTPHHFVFRSQRITLSFDIGNMDRPTVALIFTPAGAPSLG